MLSRLRRPVMTATAFALALTLVSCAVTKPRKHWWQFWRPKTVAAADERGVVPPPPGVLDPNSPGSSESLGVDGQLPPPPSLDVAAMPEPEPVRQPAAVANDLATVYFDFDSSELTAEAKAALDNNIAWIREHVGVQILIEGHCDEQGTIEYNLNLGQRRANEVRGYLVLNGVSADLLHTISYGEERPIESGQDESSFAKNRRVQFLVY